MENCEKIMKEISDKLAIQNKELEAIKAQMAYKAEKERRGKLWKNYHNEPKRYQTNNTKYHRNEEGECYYKEYSYMETTYYPERKRNVPGIIDMPINTKGFFKGDCSFPQKYVPNDYFQLPKDNELNFHDNTYFRKRTSFQPRYLPQQYFQKSLKNGHENQWHSKSKRITEPILKVLQNHMPFMIDVANNQQICASCNKKIEKGRILISHKELAVYAHNKYGWDKPIYSKEPIPQFYHFDKRCIKLRGFEDSYLGLCYIEVSKNVGKDDRARIQECGFRRPIREKEDVSEISEIVGDSEKCKEVIENDAISKKDNEEEIKESDNLNEEIIEKATCEMSTLICCDEGLLIKTMESDQDTSSEHSQNYDSDFDFGD